jgi:FkbM family methyltransferase
MAPIAQDFCGMSTIYHTRGFWWALIKQPAWHLREWLRNPAYRALLRFHRQLRRVPRFTRAQVMFAGRPIQLCDGPSFLSAWDEIFVNRAYEVRVKDGVLPCLVDAGANIGLAALFWKWRYGRFRYLGFEPDPKVAACCRENLRVWEIEGEIIEAAVAGADGRMRFQADGADGGRLTRENEPATGGLPLVEIKRLSPLLPAEIDLLKIDIEGAEGEVLQEIAPCLAQVRALFVEWHSQPGRAGLGAAMAQLEAAGFDCYLQDAAGPRQPYLAAPLINNFSQQIHLHAVRP